MENIDFIIGFLLFILIISVYETHKYFKGIIRLLDEINDNIEKVYGKIDKIEDGLVMGEYLPHPDEDYE